MPHHPLALAPLAIILFSICFAATMALIDDLNVQSFDGYIGEWSANGTLVEFYSPWCGACIQFGPVYDKVAQQVQSTTKIKVARVDITQNSALGKRLRVMGVPTLIFFIEGSSYVYPFSNGRKPEDILNYVKEGYKLTSARNDQVLKSREKIRKSRLKNVPEFDSMLKEIHERTGRLRKKFAVQPLEAEKTE